MHVQLPITRNMPILICITILKYYTLKVTLYARSLVKYLSTNLG